MNEQKSREKIRKLEKKIETLEESSATDFLTGLYNRKAFSEFFDKACEEVKWAAEHKTRRRKKFQFSLLLIDIDDFKKFNDEFGHLYGDEILEKVAKFLKESVRNFDMVARWGGEEFAIILKDTNLFQGEKRAQIILEKAQKQLPLTFSMGITQSNQKYSSEETFKKVDDALLKAKEEGKNRIVVG